jgi:hypothetical protein
LAQVALSQLLVVTFGDDPSTIGIEFVSLIFCGFLGVRSIFQRQGGDRA